MGTDVGSVLRWCDDAHRQSSDMTGIQRLNLGIGSGSGDASGAGKVACDYDADSRIYLQVGGDGCGNSAGCGYMMYFGRGDGTGCCNGDGCWP